MVIKVTFTLDDATIDRLNRTARRLAKPKSAVVREAIREYEARGDALSSEERAHLLAALDRIARQTPRRGAGAVRSELAALRAARRHAGRRHLSSVRT